MSYNAKNYTEQGGEITHIGGELVFEGDGKFGGGVLSNQAASTATTVATLKDDFNALLAKLKACGLMETDTTGAREPS